VGTLFKVEDVGRSYIDIEADRPNMMVGWRYLEVVETREDQARGSGVGRDIEVGGVHGDRAE
jgi:hypothetical protein